MNTAKNKYETPIYEDFTEYTTKVRKNLFLSSSLSIFIILNDITIEGSSTFLGIKFNNLDTYTLYIGFLLFVIYFLIHFFWLSIDKYNEDKIKLFEKYEVVNHSKITTNHIQTLDYCLLKAKEELKKIEENDTLSRKNLLNQINTSIVSLDSVLNDKEFKKSLNKFDTSFLFYFNSQNLRWTIIEFLLPIILSLGSIFLLLHAIYKLP